MDKLQFHGFFKFYFCLTNVKFEIKILELCFRLNTLDYDLKCCVINYQLIAEHVFVFAEYL